MYVVGLDPLLDLMNPCAENRVLMRGILCVGSGLGLPRGIYYTKIESVLLVTLRDR